MYFHTYELSSLDLKPQRSIVLSVRSKPLGKTSSLVHFLYACRVCRFYRLWALVASNDSLRSNKLQHRLQQCTRDLLPCAHCMLQCAQMKSSICGIYYQNPNQCSKGTVADIVSLHSGDCKTWLTCLIIEINMSSSIEKLVPLLDGSNYRVWKDSMQSYLMSQGYWRITNGQYLKPASLATTNDRYAQVE